MSREVINGIEVDLDRLPEQFEPLKPSIRRWAISDDVSREEEQQAASIEELMDLWRSVQPLFDAINEYLDANDHEEAHLLGNLAEGAMEVAYEIERRTGLNPME